jgi:DNA-directed RNA polymerase specialized sigma24 family protein
MPRLGGLAGGYVVDRAQLERAFRRLSVEQRAVIVLHHYLELPRPEIAEALGVPLGTVHSRLRNAMAALRAALDADARPGPADSAAVQATR